MTVASYGHNFTTVLIEFPNTTNWSAIGTGSPGLNAPETDYFIQGNNCISKNAWASATKGMIYNTGSDQGGSGTDGAYMAWMTHTAPNSLDTTAGAGMQFLIGSGSGDYEQYYVGGSDTMTFLKWVFVAVSETVAGDTSTGTPSTTSESYFGGLWDLPSGGPTKGAPAAIDAIRVGRCDLVIEFGTGADPEATFDGALGVHDVVGTRYGTVTQRESGGVIENSGLIQFGTSTNAVEFTDSSKAIVIREHPHVTSNFNTWEVNNASSIVSMTNIAVTSLGTTSPGRFVVNNNATVTLTTCTFKDMGAFVLDTNTTADSCTFLGTGRIEGEADLAGSTVDSPTVAADEGAVFDDRTTTGATTLSEYDGCTFIQGTNAHHAIRFGTNVDDDITLENCTFDGFSSVADANGATFRFDDTAGSINLNLVNCTVDGVDASTSNIGIDDAAGISVTVVIDPVTTKFTVEDESGTAIENARVLAETADDGGTGFPFEDAVTTLTQAAGTATLTASAVHGLATNDYVVVRGAQPDGYNKVAQITVTSTTVFTYSVDSGLSSPATGTIEFSYVAVSGLTNVSGQIESSKTWPAAQGLKGWARKKNASSPFYKDADINVSDASGGTDQVLTLQPDE